MNQEKLRKLLDRLIAASDSSEVKWRPGVKIGSFQSDFSGSSVIIDGPVAMPSIGGINFGSHNQGILTGILPEYRLRIIDERGEEVYNFAASSNYSRQMSSDDNDLSNRLESLYKIVSSHQRARADRAIDAILESLS